MKNKTGRIVVIGIIVVWIVAAIQLSNEHVYQRTLHGQSEGIQNTQTQIDDYKKAIKEYEEKPKTYHHSDYDKESYQKAKENLSGYEYRLLTMTSIYEANVEYYNTHWLLLRRPLIY